MAVVTCRKIKSAVKYCFLSFVNCSSNLGLTIMAEAENIFRNNFTLYVFEIHHYTYVIYYLIIAYTSARTLRNDYISLLLSLQSTNCLSRIYAHIHEWDRQLHRLPCTYWPFGLRSYQYVIDHFFKLPQSCDLGYLKILHYAYCLRTTWEKKYNATIVEIGVEASQKN